MSAAQPPAPIRSPCVLVCSLDEDSGLCLGCFRTLPEVAAWSRLSEEERDAVMTALPGRRGLIAPEKLGLT